MDQSLSWEDWRVTSRLCFILVVGSLPLALAGCGDAFNAGPIVYKDSERFTRKPEANPDYNLIGKPKLQEAVRKAVLDTFGPSPSEIRVPEGSGLPEGGRRLGNHEIVDGKRKRLAYKSSTTGEEMPVVGGYALYRRHCLHCHGVQGSADGPTAEFLYPLPRDYRRGVFKFTSTNPTNAKPTRADLRKTILYGVHGTSMPAFEARIVPAEIEQVMDYVIFLSMRGETEYNLIREASSYEDSNPLDADTIKEITAGVIATWKLADTQVVNPSLGRIAPVRESVLRGRDIFLGINPGKKASCTDCHGLQGLGNGSKFVDRKIFDKVVFRRMTVDHALEARYWEAWDEERSAKIIPGESHGHMEKEPEEKLPAYKTRMLTLWKPGSLDDWGNPLRPANLTLGVYKGGRRPIDLYWRIAKGINGAQMPSHAGSILNDDEIWDVINFVLALPYEPELLKDAESLKKKGTAEMAAPRTAALPPR
jgi:mono/diheme cytochrome c family protein